MSEVRAMTKAEERESLLRELPAEVRRALDAYAEARARLERLEGDHRDLAARLRQSEENRAKAREVEEAAWAEVMKLKAGRDGAAGRKP